MTSRETADEAMTRDVTAIMVEEIMDRLCEAGQNPEGQHEGITIHEHQRHDMLNVEFSGVIALNGREFTFHIRDGNRNGTELISWNDGAGFTPEPPVIMTLAPRMSRMILVDDAQSARSLLLHWKDALDPNSPRGRLLAEIPQKIAHDRYFNPGGSVRLFDDLAHSHGYDVVTDEDAKAIHHRLLSRTLGLIPATLPQGDLTDLHEKMELWAACSAPDGPLKGQWDLVLSEMSAAGLVDPGAGQAAVFANLGYELVQLTDQQRAWAGAAAALFSLQEDDGFDLAMTPLDPVYIMMETLLPRDMAPVYVDRQAEAQALLRTACTVMSHSMTLELPDNFASALARFGYRCQRFDQFIEPERAEPYPDPSL